MVERDHPHRQCNKHIKTILVRAAKVICSLAKNTKSRDEIVVYARKILQQKLEKFPNFFKMAAKLGRRIYYCLKKEVPYQNECRVQYPNKVHRRNENEKHGLKRFYAKNIPRFGGIVKHYFMN